MDNASLTLVSPSKFATIKLSRFGTDSRFDMGKARVSPASAKMEAVEAAIVIQVMEI